MPWADSILFETALASGFAKQTQTTKSQFPEARGDFVVGSDGSLGELLPAGLSLLLITLTRREHRRRAATCHCITTTRFEPIVSSKTRTMGESTERDAIAASWVV